MSGLRLADLALAFGRHIVSVVAGIVALALVGRHLGLEALGLWTAVATASYSLGLADLGLSTTMQRALARRDEAGAERALGTALRVAFLVAPTLAVAFFLLLRGVAASRGTEGVATLLLALGAGCITAPSFPLRALLLSRGHMRPVALSRSAGALAQVGLLAAILPTRPSLVVVAGGLFVAQVVELAVLALAARPLVPRIPAAVRSLAELFELLRDGAASLAVNVAVIAASRLDLVILTTLVPLRDLGPYGLACRAVDQGLLTAKQTSTALQSRLGDPEQRTRSAAVGLQILGGLGGSGLAALAVTGAPLLALWAGSADAMAPLLRVLPVVALAGFISALGEVPSSTLALGAPSPWTNARAIGFGAAVNVCATFPLAALDGARGAAAATLLGNLVTFVWIWREAVRLLGWSRHEGAAALAPGVAGCVTAGLAGWATPTAAGAAGSLVAPLVASAAGVVAAGFVMFTVRIRRGALRPSLSH